MCLMQKVDIYGFAETRLAYMIGPINRVDNLSYMGNWEMLRQMAENADNHKFGLNQHTSEKYWTD